MKKTRIAATLLLISSMLAHAQTKSTKSAPDLPTFRITVNVTNGTGGSSALYASDTLALNGTGTVKLNYETAPTLFLKADSLYRLESFQVNQTTIPLEASFPTGAADKDKGHNLYTRTFDKLKEETRIVMVWKEKPAVELKVSGTSQVVNENKAAVLQISTNIAGVPFDLRYYTEEACLNPADENARKKTGTFYARVHIDETADYKGLDRIIRMTVTPKQELTVVEVASPDTLLEGQPLSEAAIRGKVAPKEQQDTEISGVWRWENPNEGVKEGVNAYRAIFTPDSAAIYMPVSAEVKVGARRVKNVSLKQTDGGTIAIQNEKADHTYAGDKIGLDPQLTFIAIPRTGYAFQAWEGINASAAPSEDTVRSVASLSADAVVSARFAKATRHVALASVSGGKVQLANGSQLITSSADLPVGDRLTIRAIPEEGYKVTGSGYRMTAGENTTAYEGAAGFVVGASATSYEVYATFERTAAQEYLVKAEEMQNGTLVLKNGTETVNLNAAVAAGTTLSVVPLANHGYRLASLTANGEDIKDKLSFTVGKETLLKADFETVSYDVTVIQQPGGTIQPSTRSVSYGEKLAGITATPDAGYKLVHLLVNNQPVAVPYDLTVENSTTITALYQKLAVLEVLNTDEEAIYNGQTHEVAVKTAAGVGGFQVTYRLENTQTETTPVEAGTYLVTITRPADAVYAAVHKTIKLVIKPGIPVILSLPAYNAPEELSKAEATVPGHWSTAKPDNNHPAVSLRSAGSFTTIYFIPDDKNMGYLTATTPSSPQKEIEVSLPALTEHGSLQVMNGNVEVTSLKKYAGQTLRLAAKPDDGYLVDWKAIAINGATLNGDQTFTLPADGKVSLTLASSLFKAKQTIAAITGKTVRRTYTGEPILPTASDLGAVPSAGWIVSYTDPEDPASGLVPVAAGTYRIYLSRPEDATYQAYEKEEAGLLTIVPAEIKAADIKAPLASAVLKNSPLSESYLKEGLVAVGQLPVAGEFVWETPAATVDKAGRYAVRFLPGSGNYTVDPDLALQSYVSLRDAEQVTVTIRLVNPGSISLKDAEGNPIALAESQATVAAGSLLSILPASGTIAELAATDGATATIHTEGGLTTYTCIAGASNFTLTVTFRTGSDPSDVAVEGVALNTTAKTLGIGETFQLTATVSPANATNKGVTWTSSNLAVATVDNQGVVTALTVGTCRITATTRDGQKTAFCNLTVTDTPTGIEDLVALNPVYGREGMIIVEPAEPITVQIVSVAGLTIYKNKVSARIQVPVSSGLYFVQLSTADKVKTVKLRIR